MVSEPRVYYAGLCLLQGANDALIMGGYMYKGAAPRRHGASSEISSSIFFSSSILVLDFFRE